MEDCYIYEGKIKLIQLYLHSDLLEEAISEANNCLNSLHKTKITMIENIKFTPMYLLLFKTLISLGKDYTYSDFIEKLPDSIPLKFKMFLNSQIHADDEKVSWNEILESTHECNSYENRIELYHNLIPIYLLGHCYRIFDSLQNNGFMDIKKVIENIKCDFSYSLYVDHYNLIESLEENYNLKEDNDFDTKLSIEEWLEFNLIYCYPVTLPYIYLDIECLLCEAELNNNRIWYAASLISNIINQCDILYPQLSIKRVKCYELYARYLNLEFKELHNGELRSIRKHNINIDSQQKREILHLANNIRGGYSSPMNIVLKEAEKLYTKSKKKEIENKLPLYSNKSLNYYKLIIGDVKKLLGEHIYLCELYEGIANLLSKFDKVYYKIYYRKNH